MDQQSPTTGDRKTPGNPWLEFVRIGLYRRLRLLVALPLVTSTIAAGIVYAMPNRYVATAVLQIDPRQKSANDAGETSAATPLRTIEDEIETLQSDAVLAEVVDSLSLSDDAELNTPGASSLYENIVRWRFEPKASVVASLRSRLSVARVRNTQLVALRFWSVDPAKAARVANAVTDVYLREQVDGRWRTTVADNRSPGTISDAPSIDTASDRVFQSMVTQYGLSLQLPGARIITAAERPAASSGPKRIEMIAIAAGMSLAASVGAALLLALFALPDKVQRLERALACRRLTSLPTIALDDVDHAACAARRVVGDPQGAYAGAIREACSKLEQQRTPGLARVIVVTSALWGEGAEGVASNIAHCFAADGEPVLLIDADLRSKTLTRQLAGQCTRGLFEQIACQESIDDAILKDHLTGLCFLPATGPAPVPLSILNVLKSTAFAGGIGALKTEFSTIIIAAPAILDGKDASVLADIADHIVFVTAVDRTPDRTAAKAAAYLGSNRRKIAGVVLADGDDQVDRSVMSFGELIMEIRDLGAMPFSARAA